MSKLKELTEALVNLSDISDDHASGMREYSVKQGLALAIPLKHNNDVAVAQAFLSSGTVFPYHNHTKSSEIIVVYKGTIVIVTDEERRELNVGDSIAICPGCGHMLIAKTDVKVIAITIPPDAIAMPKMPGENGQ